MQRLEEACQTLLAGVRQLGEERVGLAAAGGRRLSRTVRRSLAQPPFTRSRVDGYAVMAAALDSSEGRRFTVAGVVSAGEEPPAAPPAGAVLRVMTGAALPPGVGAVIPFEDVPEGAGAGPGQAVTFTRRIRSGENVIPAGMEGTPGSVVLPAGAVCGPVEMALLAGAGETAVWVRRRARVAVIATGSELVPPGEPLRPGQIYASNLHMLAGLVLAWGAEPVAAGPLPDTLGALRGELESQAAGTDLVLVTGGVAGGDRDLSRRLVGELGWPLVVDEVDVHPGGRCAAAAAPETGTLGVFLSGGPGACLTAAALLVVPLLAALGGRDWSTIPARLAGDLVETPAGVPSGHGRRRAVPVKLSLSGGTLRATPQPHYSGSPVVTPGTDGFILIPPGGGGEGSAPQPAAALVCGDLAEVWPLTPVLPDAGLQGRK